MTDKEKFEKICERTNRRLKLIREGKLPKTERIDHGLGHISVRIVYPEGWND